MLLSGPNWIHGTDHNPILGLAEETATTTFHPEGESRTVYDESGKLLEGEKAAKHSQLVWSTIGNAFKYSNQESASIPQAQSLMDYFRSSLKDQKVDEASSTLVLQMARIWGDFIGDPIEKQSLKYLWLEECIDGGIDSRPSRLTATLTCIRKFVCCQYLQTHSGPHSQIHSRRG